MSEVDSQSGMVSEENQTLTGTFACPICGTDVPHHHSEAEQKAYHEEQLRGVFHGAGDGWNRIELKRPEESGWYLCLGVEVPLDQQGKPKDFWDHHPRWSQLSWFLWVRQGAARDVETRVPEVLYYDRMFQRWSLRNLLGNAVRDGSESRWQVIAYPKYWREVPAFMKVPT